MQPKIMKIETNSLDPSTYALYIFTGRNVSTGSEQKDVEIPPISLPIRVDYLDALEPGEELSDTAIGESLYDYLRRFPDCSDNESYAKILSSAYPHYIADMSAQILMIGHKDVDAPYVQRQISMLKIILLLDKQNIGLLYQLSYTYFQLGMMYSELKRSQGHMRDAITHLHRALKVSTTDLRVLNLLGQIEYLVGDYPAASRYWQSVIASLPFGPSREALQVRIQRIESGEVSEYPILDDLAKIGDALELYADNDFTGAKGVLDSLEERGVLMVELPNPDFYILLAKCREECNDLRGAFVAYERALELDPDSTAVMIAMAAINLHDDNDRTVH